MEKKQTAEQMYEPFYQLCRAVEEIFEADWRDTDEAAKARKLEREKLAIMGHEKETRFFQAKIGDILRDRGWQHMEPPPWYASLEEGIFHEVYGLAGLAPWAYGTTEAYRKSSSAKLIGGRLYCLIDGKSRLQPQRIPQRRREQLKRALLMATPRERMEDGFHEVYLHNGIRITIYAGDRTKKGQDVMVFRKYLVEDLTFEKLAELGTYPKEAVPLFRAMVASGFNILIAGPVRSGKTTFLQVWQKQEDPLLEGLAVATDPETPWHELMPEAPLMQLVADGPVLESMTKSLLRGDNDYILLEEMRDAAAYHLALEITSTGTLRSKATIHDGGSVYIPYKMAAAVREKYGGDLQNLIAQVFRSFHLVFRFTQHPEDRSQKRLAGISAYHYDEEKDQVSVHELCRYAAEEGTWYWKADLPFSQWSGKEYRRVEELLQNLEYRSPLKGETVVYPWYYKHLQSRGGMR